MNNENLKNEQKKNSLVKIASGIQCVCIMLVTAVLIAISVMVGAQPEITEETLKAFFLQEPFSIVCIAVIALMVLSIILLLIDSFILRAEETKREFKELFIEFKEKVKTWR